MKYLVSIRYMAAFSLFSLLIFVQSATAEQWWPFAEYSPPDTIYSPYRKQGVEKSNETNLNQEAPETEDFISKSEMLQSSSDIQYFYNFEQYNCFVP